jgi:release factor glutamine methyltransferase
LNIETAVTVATHKLRNVDSPHKEGEILLSHLLQKDRLYLILNRDEILPKNIEEQFYQLLQRRASGEPLEYITNSVSFYSTEFFIDKGALIPRPETELLIDEVLKVAKDGNSIAEIGVGSGIISITLSKKLKNSKIIGVDISENALQVAEKNRELHQANSVEFRQSDLFSNLPEKFNIIVSNPPYISDSERGKLQKELSFEPDNALYGGEVGDEFLKKIIDQFFQRTESYLICEMGYDQKEPISSYVGNRGKLSFYSDLAGFDRGFVLKR